MSASAAEETLGAALLAHATELMGLVRADGAALVSAGECVTCGRAPPPELIHEIAAWLEKRGELRPFASSSLGDLFPRALEASDVAVGCSRSRCRASPAAIMWFRPEVIKTVNWAGDPTKSVTANPASGCSPAVRSPVDQNVRHRSHLWTTSDLEAADELRRRAIENRPRAAARQRAACGEGAGGSDRYRVPRPP